MVFHVAKNSMLVKPNLIHFYEFIGNNTHTIHTRKQSTSNMWNLHAMKK